jgi:hypothetical protein
MLLPQYAGRFDVGLATFSKPIRPTFSVGTGRYHDGQRALKMEEIAYNVFYPGDVSGMHPKPRKNIEWLLR